MKNVRFVALLSLLFICSSIAAGCNQPASQISPMSTQDDTAIVAPMPNPTIPLKGAGATFPALLYTKWITQFNLAYQVLITYNAVGSGSGIQAITDKAVDFGASDGIMTAKQIAAAEAAGGPILHIPMTMGSVAVVYNLDGIKSGELKLTGAVLADIFLKNITKWNDARIAELNPTLPLPDSDIIVAHRSDGSGTNFIFTNYMCKVSAEFATKIGNATSVNWPGDIQASGNPALAALVQQTPNSIGYVELAYALQNNMTFCALQNAVGVFIVPSLTSTTAAAEGVTLPDDMKVMLTDSSNKDAYPIVGFTWILVYQNQTDSGKGAEVVDYLWWAIHNGQSYSTDLMFAPLPSDAIVKAEVLIKSIQYHGVSILGN